MLQPLSAISKDCSLDEVTAFSTTVLEWLWLVDIDNDVALPSELEVVGGVVTDGVIRGTFVTGVGRLLPGSGGGEPLELEGDLG